MPPPQPSCVVMKHVQLEPGRVLFSVSGVWDSTSHVPPVRRTVLIANRKGGLPSTISVLAALRRANLPWLSCLDFQDLWCYIFGSGEVADSAIIYEDTWMPVQISGRVIPGASLNEIGWNWLEEAQVERLELNCTATRQTGACALEYTHLILTGGHGDAGLSMCKQMYVYLEILKQSTQHRFRYLISTLLWPRRVGRQVEAPGRRCSDDGEPVDVDSKVNHSIWLLRRPMVLNCGAYAWGKDTDGQPHTARQVRVDATRNLMIITGHEESEQFVGGGLCSKRWTSRPATKRLSIKNALPRVNAGFLRKAAGRPVWKYELNIFDSNL
ncbi:hypothetical protein IW261DRAFT_1593568 [Armillaria novae-zelandiae]|uniref:Uncharacterized protein n=1 Tax=Armillaria novae-zelandiae TaxID=153914 RepID=A0AA39P957_9AGAR|nr:hypothetical protein IW261DRAFT_1593568 [Armillaria novae-zelandiae]